MGNAVGFVVCPVEFLVSGNSKDADGVPLAMINHPLSEKDASPVPIKYFPSHLSLSLLVLDTPTLVGKKTIHLVYLFLSLFHLKFKAKRLDSLVKWFVA